MRVHLIQSVEQFHPDMEMGQWVSGSGVTAASDPLTHDEVTAQ